MKEREWETTRKRKTSHKSSSNCWLHSLLSRYRGGCIFLKWMTLNAFNDSRKGNVFQKMWDKRFSIHFKLNNEMCWRRTRIHTYTQSQTRTHAHCIHTTSRLFPGKYWKVFEGGKSYCVFRWSHSSFPSFDCMISHYGLERISLWCSTWWFAFDQSGIASWACVSCIQNVLCHSFVLLYI